MDGATGTKGTKGRRQEDISSVVCCHAPGDGGAGGVRKAINLCCASAAFHRGYSLVPVNTSGRLLL